MVSNQLSEWYIKASDEARAHLVKSQNGWNKFLVRQLDLLVNSQELPPAHDPEIELWVAFNFHSHTTLKPPHYPLSPSEIINLANELEGLYGSAVVSKEGKELHLEPELSEIIRSSRDWDELLWAWTSWRDVTGPGIREKFSEIVSLMNNTAIENGGFTLRSAKTISCTG
jgi:peptidyl-dipeptidase A